MNTLSKPGALAAIIGILFFTSASLAATQRLKVQGTWDGKQLHVERVKLQNPNKDASRIRVSGPVHQFSYANRRMKIGPVALNWPADRDAEFSTVGLGDVLKIRAQRNRHSAFTVLSWERTTVDTPRSVELVGTVTGSRDQEDGEETALFLAEIPTYTPRRLYKNGRMRLRRLDDKRPDEQLVINIGSVRTTIGGELGLKSKAREDRDLDRDDDDRNIDSDEQAKLEAFFELNDDVSAFVEMKAVFSQDYDVDSKTSENNFEVQRGQSWIYFDQPLGLPVGVQVGRQNFAENREWWWDTDLDAVRLYISRYSFNIELAVAQDLAPRKLGSNGIDGKDRDIFRLFGRATLRLGSDTKLGLFYLYQDDHSSRLQPGDIIASSREDKDDSTLTWVGARLYGDLEDFGQVETEYWIDVARVEGSETLYDFSDTGVRNSVVDSVVEQDRSGWAYDAGATFLLSDFRIGAINEPTITIGYAYGSGDNTSDGTFRPTGLNDNNGKFNGVDRFRYYGELARPELSNLAVTTASLGFMLGPDSSIELLHHNYRQVVPSTQHSLRIRARSTGISRQLGNEIDLVLGIEEWEHWEVELIGSYFLPGNAFVLGDTAWFFAGKLNYNF